MADQAPKTTSLTIDEFKSLAITSTVQLQNFLNASVAITPQNLTDVEKHLARLMMWLRSWSLISPVVQAPADGLAAPKDAVGAPPQTNGAAPAKRRGGWPKGQPRTRQAKAPAVTQ